MKTKKTLFDGKLFVQIHLSRPVSGSPCEYFVLTIEDEASRSRFAEVQIPLDEFANMMSSRIAHGTAEVFVSSVLGYQHECKTVLVPMKDSSKFYSGDEPVRMKAMETLAVAAEEMCPGWTADRERCFNGHNRKGDTYVVIVRRYVPKAEGRA